MQVAIVIPTLNGGEIFLKVLAGLRDQSLPPRTVLVIDSGSVDDTVPHALAYGARVHKISPAEFNHGTTRELGRQLIKADCYLYLTQDAVPAHPHLLANLVKPLADNPSIALVYGRQLPWPDASPLEAFNRGFNYPGSSRLKQKADRVRLGLKTVFCSNVCAAYRSSALEAVGGFAPVIMCEDQYVAARMIAAGYSIYYAAEASVYHSHNYLMREEFKRYFDAGVFFGSHEPWIADYFGTAGSEGRRLFQAGRRFFISAGQAHVVPYLMLRLLNKLVGYQLGSRERLLPLWLKSRLSLQRHYWKTGMAGLQREKH